MHSVTRTHHNYHFIQMALSALLVLVLSGCGGGGSSSNGSVSSAVSISSVSSVSSASSISSDSSASSTPAPELTANAGEDVVVDAGDIVELKPGGTGNITDRTWTRLAGPPVRLRAVDIDQGHFTFVAPNTGIAPQITIEYQLTVSDSSGSTASDTITIHINRVNQSPEANAGADFTVGGLSEVELPGSGVDLDGTVESYFWQQTGTGDRVTLVNTDQAVARFTAPSTEEILTLEFSLTVTDNDGATATDSVAVTVISENAPVIDLVFPPAQGGYTEPTINAFGRVEARAGATLDSVRVDAGGVSVTAMVDADGNWHAENIPVVLAQNRFTLRVEAEDDVGRLGYAYSELQSSYLAAGSGMASWISIVALELDIEAQVAYVLTESTSGLLLTPVDLKTGERKSSITDFRDSTLGITQTAFLAMLYDKIAGRFYITSNPEAQGLPPKVISVERETGMRKVLSGGDVGAGPDFISPFGLVFGPDNQLLVVDSLVQAILAVDPITGNRSVLADENIAGVGVQYPSRAVWDASVNRLLVSSLINSTPILNIDLSSEPISGSVLTSGEVGETPEPQSYSGGMVLDGAGNRLFFRNVAADNIVAIALASGDHSLLAENFLGGTTNFTARGDMAYDPVHKLLYSVAEPTATRGIHGLFVIDVESGNKVLLSRPSN